jgi:hypothetical protein
MMFGVDRLAEFATDGAKCLVNAEIAEVQSGGKEDRELVRFPD